MNFNNFTIKAQEVVQKAVQLTRTNGHQAIEPEHLLKAIITEGDTVVRFIFQKLDINLMNVERPLDAALQKLPHVSGGEPYLSNDASQVLDKANDIASKNGDQYVTVEALLMALFEVKSTASTILKDAGMLVFSNAVFTEGYEREYVRHILIVIFHPLQHAVKEVIN